MDGVHSILTCSRVNHSTIVCFILHLEIDIILSHKKKDFQKVLHPLKYEVRYFTEWKRNSRVGDEENMTEIEEITGKNARNVVRKASGGLGT